MFDRQPLRVVLACACVLAASGAQAAKYSVVDQGVEVGSDANRSGFRVALNATGVVAVTAQDRAKKIDHGVVTDLGALSATFGSNARAIDDAGDVSGSSPDTGGWSRGVMWTDGGMTNVGVVPGYTDSEIDAANAAGHGVGTSWGDLSSMVAHVILYSQGQLHDLGTPASGRVLLADGINATDEITGVLSASNAERHAFVYRSGAFRDLGTLSHGDGGSNESWGYAINDKGVIVGYSSVGDGFSYHAMAYAKGAMHDLGTLDTGPAASSFAYGVNSLGTVVGMSEPDWSGEQTSAFVLFKVQGRMLDLNKLLVPKNHDWHLLAAYAINDAGQIAGIGTREGVGGVRVFLATPEQ